MRYNSYKLTKEGIIVLILDLKDIGNNLYKFRKKNGYTQAEVAEKADLSTRTYAEIERGGVNMRIETFLKICTVLQITPDKILTKEISDIKEAEEEIFKRLKNCHPKGKETAIKILQLYLESLN